MSISQTYYLKYKPDTLFSRDVRTLSLQKKVRDIYAFACVCLACQMQNILVGCGLSIAITTWIGYAMAAIMYLGVLYYILNKEFLLSKVFQRLPFLMFLLTACFVSASWSWMPLGTLYRSVSICLFSLSAIYIGSRYNYVQLTTVILLPIVFAICASVIINNASRFDSAIPDQWSGIYSNSNTLGQVGCCGFLLTAFLPAHSIRNKTLRLIMCVCSSVVVVRSESRTSLVILSVLAALYLIKNIKMSSTRVKNVLLLLCLPFFFLLGSGVIYFINASEKFGLSGRDNLWQLVFPYVCKKPFLGYGYDAFWHGWEGPSAGVWAQMPFYKPPHSHNGFIEIALSFGVCGIVLLLLYIGSILKKVSSLNKSTYKMLLFSIIMLVVMSNMSEAKLLSNSLNWFLLLAYSGNLYIYYARGS